MVSPTKVHRKKKQSSQGRTELIAKFSVIEKCWSFRHSWIVLEKDQQSYGKFFELIS